jgi:hypothetical protein
MAKTFQIRAQFMTGKSHCMYEVAATTTIREVKEKILEREGFPVDQQRLIFAGKELEDDDTMDSHGIEKDAKVHVVLNLRKQAEGEAEAE